MDSSLSAVSTRLHELSGLATGRSRWMGGRGPGQWGNQPPPLRSPDDGQGRASDCTQHASMIRSLIVDLQSGEPKAAPRPANQSS